MDDRLKLVASSALLSLFSSGKVSTPISSKALLVRVITCKLAQNSNLPRFRLTDLAQFELALESLAHNWDEAELSLVREEGQLVVMEVILPSGASSASGLNFNPRKRKRVIDEEADSAAGSEPEEEEAIQEIGVHRQSGLAGFSKQQREVYSLMQKGTAKGKLLAEQVTN